MQAAPSSIVERLAKLISEGEAILGTVVVTPGELREAWIGHRTYRTSATERMDGTRFCKWTADAVAVLARLIPIGHESHELISQFKNLPCSSRSLKWGLAMLMSVQDSCQHGLFDTTSTPNTVELVKTVCKRFHAVAKQLERRRAGRQPLVIEDEYDVQDLLNALLLIHFEDVRKEEPTASNAGQSARIDFLIKKERIAVEVKVARASLLEKQLGDDLLVDIARYKQHAECDALVCFIYDPNRCLRNGAGLRDDLEEQSSDQFKVAVEISPK